MTPERPLTLAAGCFVRAAPNAAARPLGLAKRGTRLVCAAAAGTDGWIAVEWSGGIGWVSERFTKDTVRSRTSTL